MATRFIDKITADSDLIDRPRTVAIGYHETDNVLKYRKNGSVVALVDDSDVPAANLDETTLANSDGVFSVVDGSLDENNTTGEDITAVTDAESTTFSFTNGLLTTHTPA